MTKDTGTTVKVIVILTIIGGIGLTAYLVIKNNEQQIIDQATGQVESSVWSSIF